jgi:hypothetical protein
MAYERSVSRKGLPCGRNTDNDVFGPADSMDETVESGQHRHEETSTFFRAQCFDATYQIGTKNEIDTVTRVRF